MAENVAPTSGATADATRGVPYYEKLKRDLRETLNKKRQLDKNMVTTTGFKPIDPDNRLVDERLITDVVRPNQQSLEDQIYIHEASYLEETGAGNIIKGFDSYIKGVSTSSTGTGNAGGGTSTRRKGTIMEQDRVFSRSSASFMREVSPASSPQTTPSHAPTPTSSHPAAPSSARESNHPTPTSATSTKATAAASTNATTTKKNRKGTAAATAAAAAAAAAAADKDKEKEEDESEGKQPKRLKITYARGGAGAD